MERYSHTEKKKVPVEKEKDINLEEIMDNLNL